MSRHARRPWLAGLAIIAFACNVAAAGAARRWSHVRAVTPGAADLLAQATGRSAVITALLDQLERTDVVVYLSDSMARTAGEPAASLRFMTSAAGIRYVHVLIHSWDAPPWERIAWLGHELQHALEIAKAPEVRDGEGVRRLYGRLGWKSPAGFESAGALAMGERVRNELCGQVRVPSFR